MLNLTKKKKKGWEQKGQRENGAGDRKKKSTKQGDKLSCDPPTGKKTRISLAPLSNKLIF